MAAARPSKRQRDIGRIHRLANFAAGDCGGAVTECYLVAAYRGFEVVDS